MPFQVVAQRSLRDQLVPVIREAILSGKLRPGDRVIEYKLAREMRVSQNTVREALIMLEQEGLITRIPNKGAFVTELSPETMEQIYAIRIELEALAVKLAKEKMRPADLDELQALMDEMHQAAGENDPIAFCRVDFSFHRRLWEPSGNIPLIKALTILVAPQFSYVLLESLRTQHTLLPAIAEHHQQILDLVRNESAEAAAAGVKKIIGKFRSYAQPLLP
jgi:DNA-binding GntR family transcriptional regulator